MNLEDYIDEIEKVMKEKTDERLKKIIIQNLWSKYQDLKEKSGISQNNEIYSNNTKLEIKEVDKNSLLNSISNLKNNSLTDNDIHIILDYIIYNLSEQLKKISIEVNGNTLDGFCELSQLLTIKPLEELGLNVTKNTASDFNYKRNHAFGTVTFMVGGKEKTYLIDPTYKQFFLKENCTKGKKYIDGEISPGYYTDPEFATKLLKTGYIELTEETARKYGEPFSKTTLDMDYSDIDYYNVIKSSRQDYSYKSDLEGLNYKFPRTV